MICKRCGMEIPNEAKICGYCGTEILLTGGIYNGGRKGDYMPPTEEEMFPFRRTEEPVVQAPPQEPVKMLNYQEIMQSARSGQPMPASATSDPVDPEYAAQASATSDPAGPAYAAQVTPITDPAGPAYATQAITTPEPAYVPPVPPSPTAPYTQTPPNTYLSPEYYSPQPGTNQVPPQFQNMRTYSQLNSYDINTGGNAGKGVSIASLVLGIVSLVMCCCVPWLTLILALVGLCLGIAGIAKAEQGKGMAIGGLICSIIGLIGGLIMFLATLSSFVQSIQMP